MDLLSKVPRRFLALSRSTTRRGTAMTEEKIRIALGLEKGQTKAWRAAAAEGGTRLHLASEPYGSTWTVTDIPDFTRIRWFAVTWPVVDTRQ